MRSLILLAGILGLISAVDSASQIDRSPEPPVDAEFRHHSPRLVMLESGSGTLSPPGNGYLILTHSQAEAPPTTLQVHSQKATSISRRRWESIPELKTESLISTKPRRESEPPTRTTSRIEAVHQQRTFFLHVTDDPLNDPRGYHPVRSRIVREGEFVRIYLDERQEFTPRQKSLARQIIQHLDNRIIPSATQLVGHFSDVDGDSKLAILLTPRLDELQGGKTSLNGFVRACDFESHYPRPFSNAADIIYINSLCPVETNLLTLLAHEYWHVLQFSHRVAVPKNQRRPSQGDWISEGTAHLAELRFGGDGSNLSNRIACWLSSPEEAPLVVSDYYSRGLWRHEGCRGGLFLFFRWCERTYGPRILEALLHSAGRETECFEELTGETFERLQTWAMIEMLEESFSTRTEKAEIPLIDRAIFPDRSLAELQIRDAASLHRKSVQLHPTASFFMSVSDDDNLEISSSESVPIRVIYVPAAHSTSAN